MDKIKEILEVLTNLAKVAGKEIFLLTMFFVLYIIGLVCGLVWYQLLAGILALYIPYQMKKALEIISGWEKQKRLIKNEQKRLNDMLKSLISSEGKKKNRRK